MMHRAGRDSELVDGQRPRGDVRAGMSALGCPRGDVRVGDACVGTLSATNPLGARITLDERATARLSRLMYRLRHFARPICPKTCQ